MQEPGREGGNAERNAGGGPGAGATARIRRPKRGAECGGRSGSERETGVHRPEHGTGARDRSAPPGTRDRSASRGAWAEARGRVRGRGARAGCGGRCARTGVRGPECGLEAQEPPPESAAQSTRPGREGGNAERNAGGGPGAGATARIRRPKRGAECGGQVCVGARDRGTPPGTRDRCARPERTARNTGPECEPGCVGRSARPGARAGCGGRCARTGVRARSARAVPPGTRGRSVGPEREPGCVGRSARPTQGRMRGAGARGPGCEGRNTGPERGDRSLSPERESLLPKSALQIRHPKRGAECGGRSGSERETGVHRPEHGTGVRAGVRRQECGGRSAETGVRGPDARTGAREPECEPGCGGRSARPGAGAGVRGRVRTQNLR